MNNNDIISVIIPVYNVEKYLCRCIDSVLSQTYKNIEVILVDDGSTDGSSDICNDYQLKDSRIKVIHTTNGGVSNARNIGIDVSTGKYIGFVDSDDWISSDMYEKLYNEMIRNNADIVQCSFLFVNEKNESIKPFDKNDINKICDKSEGISRLVDENFISGVCNKLFTRKIIGDNRFEIGKKMSEDAFFNFKVFLNCNKSVEIVDVGYFYFLRNNSATNNKFNKDFFDSIYFDKKMMEILKNKNSVLERKAYNRLARTSIFLACKIRQDKFQKKYKSEYIKLLNIIKEYSKIFDFGDKFTAKYKILILAIKINKRMFSVVIDSWIIINNVFKGDVDV